MRRRLIETLIYPRLFVLENIGLRDCPQDSLFDASCDCCRDCDLRQDCHWLRCLDNFTDLANKPVHTLHASLLYSIKLIEACTERLQHNSKACPCDSCTWLKDARQLSREFSSQFVWMVNKDPHTERSRLRWWPRAD